MPQRPASALDAGINMRTRPLTQDAETDLCLCCAGKGLKGLKQKYPMFCLKESEIYLLHYVNSWLYNLLVRNPITSWQPDLP